MYTWFSVTDVGMDKYVDHIEMEPAKLGNHTNISGVAVLDITFGEGGRVVGAKAISGHRIALSLLIGAVPKWRFKPIKVRGAAALACGRLHLKYSVVDSVSIVQLEDITE